MASPPSPPSNGSDGSEFELADDAASSVQSPTDDAPEGLRSVGPAGSGAEGEADDDGLQDLDIAFATLKIPSLAPGAERRAPEAAARKPIALGPEPIALGPEPIALGPEPIALGPKPIALGPEPIALGPKPIALGPKPIALGPEPIALGPKPIALAPAPPPARAPIALDPEPIALAPEPFTLESDPPPARAPIALGPEPIALAPEPFTLGSDPPPARAPIALGPEPIALAPEPFTLESDPPPARAPIALDPGLTAPAPRSPPPARAPIALGPEPIALAPEPPPPPPRRPITERIAEAAAKLEAKATGNLARTPLVHLLVYSLDQRLTGTTVMQGADGALHALYFERGVPSKVMTEHPVAPLDRVLLELRLLDEATLARSLQHVSLSGQLHGHYLVSTGLLTPQRLLDALGRQLVHKVTHLLSLPSETTFSFFQDVNLIEDYGGRELTAAEPLALIMAGVRTRARDAVVDQTLARLGEMRLAMHPDADTAALGLTDDEARVVEELWARPTTLGRLRDSRLAQPRVVELTVYALVITRSLQLGAQARPPIGFDPTKPKRARTPRGGPVAGAVPIRLEAEPIVLAADDGSPTIVETGVGHAQVGGHTPPDAAAPDPLPRRGAGAASSLAPNRRGSATGRPTTEPAPRRGLATGRGAEPEPRPAATAAGRGQPLPRRGFATGRADPLPRRGTASTAIAPPSETVGVAGPLPAHAPAHAPAPAAAHAPAPAQVPAPARPPAPGAAAARPPAPAPTRMPAPAPAAPRTAGAGGSSLSRAEIDARAADVDGQNYFEILGVDQAASADEIQAAYFKLAKVWHPDRLPPELRDAQAAVGKVFARMNEAHRTLTEPKRRAEYVRVMADGGGSPREQEIVARAIDSAMVFRKAEVALKKGALEEAEKLTAEACEADPGQPEYRTVLAWIRAQRRGLPANPSAGRGFYREELDVLDEVLRDEPGFERALFYRAELLKRIGEHERAYKDFKAIAVANPRNIDAAREVRLYEVRKRKDKDEGGLFGRLLGRGAKKGG